MNHSPLTQGRPGCHGFTLVELLSVIAVLAILAAILFPFARGASQKAASAKCLGNLRAIGAAAHSFAGDNNGRLMNLPAPGAGAQWDAQLAPYLGINLYARGNFATAFVCPGGKRFSANPSSFPLSRNLSYGMNTRIAPGPPPEWRGLPLAAIKDAQTLILIADRELTTGSNENYVTGQGSGNAIFINDSANRLNLLPYDRHGGFINILFVDGHAAAHAKLGRTVAGFTPNWPRSTRFGNDSTVAPAQ